jgi:hypothetical protein
MAESGIQVRIYFVIWVIRSSFVLQCQSGSDHSGSVIFPSHMLDNIVAKRAALDLGRAFH